MASSRTNLLQDKQTIVTNLALTSAFGLHDFMKDKLPEWVKNRKKVKILIICGAHGNADGTIADEAEFQSLCGLKVRLTFYFEN